MQANLAAPDRILLGDPCVAIGEGCILAVGARDEIRALAGPGTDILDLGDARVLPGLRDAHAHVVMTGLARRRIDLHGMSLTEVREAVRRRAEETPGRWIIGSGFSLDELGLDRLPVSTDLDDICPDHPVRLASHDLHALWVNTRALQAVDRPPDAPSYFTEDEIRVFLDAAGRESPDERLSATREVQSEFHAHGITSVQEHGRFDELRTLAAMALADELELRVKFSVRDHEFAGFLGATDEHPAFPGILEMNAQKMFLDGALGSRTAWLLEPYCESVDTGHRARSAEEAREKVRFAAKAGFPTFFHAIGDAAVREALDLAALAPGLPHRVEHAQLIHPDDLPRFATQGVMASVQPVHLLTDTPILLENWGEERARRSFAVRSLLLTGATVRLGSDTPVETLDPMKGVFAATHRKTVDGKTLPGNEAVPVETALHLYYSFPALAPGCPADLSVWPIDPVRATPEELLDLRPVATLFAGKVVHHA